MARPGRASAGRPFTLLGVIIAAAVIGYTALTGSNPLPSLTDASSGGEPDSAQTGTSSASPNISPSPSGPSAATGPPPAPSVTEARAARTDIRTRQPGSMSAYAREDFPHWASDGTEFGWAGNEGSCDVHDDALIRDGSRIRTDEDCSITAGFWTGPYTAGSFTDPTDLDIDHIVPLANAYRSGASDWDENRKEAFANDPGVLLSTDDGANQEKSDNGPEDWGPSNTAYHCEYARRWIAIKSIWSLTVATAARAALTNLLATCTA